MPRFPVAIFCFVCLLNSCAEVRAPDQRLVVETALSGDRLAAETLIDDLYEADPAEGDETSPIAAERHRVLHALDRGLLAFNHGDLAACETWLGQASEAIDRARIKWTAGNALEEFASAGAQTYNGLAYEMVQVDYWRSMAALIQGLSASGRIDTGNIDPNAAATYERAISYARHLARKELKEIEDAKVAGYAGGAPWAQAAVALVLLGSNEVTHSDRQFAHVFLHRALSTYSEQKNTLSDQGTWYYSAHAPEWLQRLYVRNALDYFGDTDFVRKNVADLLIPEEILKKERERPKGSATLIVLDHRGVVPTRDLLTLIGKKVTRSPPSFSIAEGNNYQVSVIEGPDYAVWAIGPDPDEVRNWDPSTFRRNDLHLVGPTPTLRVKVVASGRIAYRTASQETVHKDAVKGLHNSAETALAESAHKDPVKAMKEAMAANDQRLAADAHQRRNQDRGLNVNGAVFTTTLTRSELAGFGLNASATQAVASLRAQQEALAKESGFTWWQPAANVSLKISVIGTLGIEVNGSQRLVRNRDRHALGFVGKQLLEDLESLEDRAATTAHILQHPQDRPNAPSPVYSLLAQWGQPQLAMATVQDLDAQARATLFEGRELSTVRPDLRGGLFLPDHVNGAMIDIKPGGYALGMDVGGQWQPLVPLRLAPNQITVLPLRSLPLSLAPAAPWRTTLALSGLASPQ